MNAIKEIIELLIEAREKGIIAEIENDKLIFKILKGKKVHPELVNKLKNKKNEIFSFVSSEKEKSSLLNHTKEKITPFDREKIKKIPLSFSQESTWLEYKLKGDALNLIPQVLRFNGDLDVDALEFALAGMVSRHQVFRTLIKEENGVPYQEIISENDWKLVYTSQIAKEKELNSYLQEELSYKFNLSKDFCLRAHLIKISDKEHVLIIIFHHIAIDGFSDIIFSSEVVELYLSRKENRKSKLPELKIQYADYAVWQRNYLQGNILEGKIKKLKSKLEHVSPLNFPTDFERTQFQSTKGEIVTLHLNKTVSESIKNFLNNNDVTSYMFFLTVFKILLFRYSNQEDICVGSPVANRSQMEIESLIGYFVNSIPIRTCMNSDIEFIKLLKLVKKNVLEAYEFQDVPFEKIVNTVLDRRVSNRHPIYQVLFNVQNYEKPEKINLKDVELSIEDTPKFTSAEFELSLTLSEQIDGFDLNLKYSTDLFLQETANQFLRQFNTLLKSILSNPNEKISELEIFSEYDLSKILIDYNSTTKDYPSDITFLHLFNIQAEKNPDRVAVIFRNKELTYKELNEKSNQFANYLRKKGSKIGSIVPIFIDRSLEMIIGLLGILKCGAAYIAIPIDFPAKRVQYIVNESLSGLVVTNKKYVSLFNNENFELVQVDEHWKDIEKEKYEDDLSDLDPNNLSYVVYTSGSSGQPKAVMTEHGSLLNFLYSMIDPLNVNEESCFLGLASYSFDGSCMELYLPLLVGGKVVIVPQETVKDGFLLKDLIDLKDPTHLHATPSGFQLLIDAGWKNDEKSLILSGGEALNDNLRNKLTSFNKNKIWNLYGPTETTLYATFKEIGENEKITVGKPISNYQIYIVDENDKPVPIGVIGEVLIGGVGVARGYLNSEKLSSQKFLNNQFDKNNGSRYYRTGDLGKWNHKGEIELIGRKDNQIKLRGFRIELEEIEIVLNKHDNIKCSTVIISDDKNEEYKKIIAYIVPNNEFDETDVREYLNLKLPNYMVPTHIIELSKFPLSRNGKINKKALPDPDKFSVKKTNYEKPKSHIEVVLTEIWEELLQIRQISVTDDFFLLGGNSLLAVRLVAKIKNSFNKEFPINLIFESPTIRSLSSKLGYVNTEDKHQPLMSINKKGNKTPIFCTPPVGGYSLGYNDLSKILGNDQPFYGFVARGLDGTDEPYKSVEETALSYIKEIKKIDPNGPYIIGGYSFGAKVAYEIAFQLEKEGYEINRLFIFDSPSPDIDNFDYSSLYPSSYKDWLLLMSRLFNRLSQDNDSKQISLSINDFDGLQTKEEQLKIFYDKLKDVGEDFTFDQVRGNIDVYIHNSLLAYSARGKIIKSPITLIKCGIEHESLYSKKSDNNFNEFFRERRDKPDFGWGDFTANIVSVHQIECTHFDLLEQPYVRQLSLIVKNTLVNPITK